MPSLVKPSWNQVVIRPLKGWRLRVGHGIILGVDYRIQSFGVRSAKIIPY
jgi:hypothetical protein